MTRRLPAEEVLVDRFTITTICRARWMRGVDMANASRLVKISWTWHPVQSNSSEEANIPIVSMNSSAGMPFRT